MDINDPLLRAILSARQRVYRAAQPTPMELLPVELSCGVEIYVKREDLSPVKSYKWRGAFNRMAQLSAEEIRRGVITASAGNHAQGVALAASHLGVQAEIVMPRTTPQVKQAAVRRLGGEWVSIRLEGDSYDSAMAAALELASQRGAVYVHAYDDAEIIAGQGTMADEVVLSGSGPFDAAFLQIGGGGMAAGVSSWLRHVWPGIRIIGVEGEDQASMAAAFAAGKPVRLDSLDLFCDGTAVRQVGQLPYAICRQTVDELITVSNQEVADAMRLLWEGLRTIGEPSGAMGLAGILRQAARWRGQKVLCVLCGANLDFGQLGSIALQSIANTRYYRIRIREERGAMLALLKNGLAGLNITDFQYGKIDPVLAWPVFGLAGDANLFTLMEERLDKQGIEWQIVRADEPSTRFRAIALRADLLRHPVFLSLEFYERAGALTDFLETVIQGRADFTYFNYRATGERVGRALIGLEFHSPAERDQLLPTLPEGGPGFRRCAILKSGETAHLIGQG